MLRKGSSVGSKTESRVARRDSSESTMQTVKEESSFISG